MTKSWVWGMVYFASVFILGDPCTVNTRRLWPPFQYPPFTLFGRQRGVTDRQTKRQNRGSIYRSWRLYAMRRSVKITGLWIPSVCPNVVVTVVACHLVNFYKLILFLCICGTVDQTWSSVSACSIRPNTAIRRRWQGHLLPTTGLPNISNTSTWHNYYPGRFQCSDWIWPPWLWVRHW